MRNLASELNKKYQFLVTVLHEKNPKEPLKYYLKTWMVMPKAIKEHVAGQW